MRMPALLLAVVTGIGAAPAPLPMSGEAILGRAKAVFRAYARPPYVVYVVERRDITNRRWDFENSYTLKVWCRNSDGSALVRRMWNGVAYGPLQHIVVTFDAMVDPGPPTADVFARAGGDPAGVPAPDPAPAALPLIGGVAIHADYDYRVVRARRDGDDFDLQLAPRRDPDRNRIDEVWLDATTFELHRMRVRDHLFLGASGDVLDDEFDVRFSDRLGLPVIASIHGHTLWADYETTYRFVDVQFPDALPAWYFEPRSYGAHAAEAPS